MNKEIFYLISWFLVAFGWIVSFVLAFVTFKRGEVRKTIDAMVDNLEKCSNVALKAWTNDAVSESMLDQEIGALVSRISIYNKIVEKKAGFSFLTSQDFVALYDISSGFDQVRSGNEAILTEKIQESDMVCSNLIYEIESMYFDYSMSKGVFNSFYHFPGRHPDAFGAGLVIIVLFSIYSMMKLIA